MSCVVVVDSDYDRREAFGDALQVADRHRYGSIEGASASDETNAIWFVHFSDLAVDAKRLAIFWQKLEGQAGCIFYSGAGLNVTPASEQQLRVALAPLPGEDQFSLDVERCESWGYVRAPLSARHASKIGAVCEQLRHARNVADLVQAIEGREWPENLVALYLCSLALERGDEALRKKVAANMNLASLTELAMAEVGQRGLVALNKEALTAENAAQASREIQQCLKQLTS